MNFFLGKEIFRKKSKKKLEVGHVYTHIYGSGQQKFERRA